LTQHNPGKHAAASSPRWLFLAQPDALRRGRDAGRRVAEAPAGATRRPRLAHLVPLGALLVATTSAVAVALPDDHSDAPTTTSAKGTWQPPTTPHTISTGTLATPAAYVTPPAGKHRAERSAATAAPTAAPTAAARASTGGRHRAAVVPDEPQATSKPAAQPSAAPAPQQAQASAPAATPTKTSTPAPATAAPTTGSAGSTGGVVGSLVGTVGGVVGGVVGGLLGGGTTAAK
jgi:hypothetical protein